VKSVDASTGVILLTSGAGATARTITVNTTEATMLKRYAPDSVRFDAALPAPIMRSSPATSCARAAQRTRMEHRLPPKR